jgi:hypothetical protein
LVCEWSKGQGWEIKVQLFLIGEENHVKGCGEEYPQEFVTPVMMRKIGAPVISISLRTASKPPARTAV